MKKQLIKAIGVALVASFATSLALARNPSKPIVVSSTYELIVPPDAPEPLASGQVTLESFMPALDVQVAVNCKRLTPEAQYRVMCRAEWQQKDASSGLIMYDSWLEAHTLTADRKGRLCGGFEVVHWTCESWVSVSNVWIENEAAQVVLQMKGQ